MQHVKGARAPAATGAKSGRLTPKRLHQKEQQRQSQATGMHAAPGRMRFKRAPPLEILERIFLVGQSSTPD